MFSFTSSLIISLYISLRDNIHIHTPIPIFIHRNIYTYKRDNIKERDCAALAQTDTFKHAPPLCVGRTRVCNCLYIYNLEVDIVDRTDA